MVPIISPKFISKPYAKYNSQWNLELHMGIRKDFKRVT